jgi:hypothetical protein
MYTILQYIPQHSRRKNDTLVLSVLEKQFPRFRFLYVMRQCKTRFNQHHAYISEFEIVLYWSKDRQHLVL